MTFQNTDTTQSTLVNQSFCWGCLQEYGWGTSLVREEMSERQLNHQNPIPALVTTGNKKHTTQALGNCWSEPLTGS